MRLLKRNTRIIYYKLLVDKQPIKDEYENETGEYELIYSQNPVAVRMSVSAARGESYTRQFGDMESYDKVMITDDTDCPIDESSILWIDNLDTSQPHDYIVRKVAKGLNSIMYAVRKVNVSA